MGSEAINLNFLKKLDSTDKLMFHVSNLNTRVLDQLPSIWRKLWEDLICMWVTPKTNRPSFCLILKISHALDGLFSVLYSLHGQRFLMNEGSLNVTTFRYCCLGFFLTWNPLFIFRYKCCDSHFSCFAKYIFPQLQTCSADCTKDSCSSYIPSNFYQLFSF